MIESLLDACQFVLEDQGEPQSSFWLASQVMEMKLWRPVKLMCVMLSRWTSRSMESDLDLCSWAMMSLRCGRGKPIRPNRVLRSPQGLFLSGNWGSTTGQAS